VGKNGKLVAVIVTFNRLDALQVTLGHTTDKGFYRVVVVNNCSTDGTREWLDSRVDEALVVIHADANRGGAGGFNVGFKHVTEKIPEADWLVCFDDDAFPEGDIVANFDALDIPEDVGGLAGAVYLPDGRISEMNRPSRNPFWHLGAFLGAGFGGRHGFHVGDECYQTNEPMEIDASSFVGCFVRLSLIRSGAIGMPRTELFIYADDIIYVLEMRKAGYRHIFVPTITFQHDCQTLVNQQDVYHPLWKVYYTYRNRLEMYRIASGFFYPFILLLKIPKAFLTVRFYEKHERKIFLSITAKAVFHGVTRNYSRTHDEVVAFSQVTR
jgi:rhamnopyranosyl-N-acetylglucosaminyl-diphospho-decaprenol beta-1,3/1,4-galactofuranosyltransferase